MGAEQITWAGRTLSGTDRFGTWTCEVPAGWWDSPDVKGESADQPAADGEYDLPIYNASRVVTFTGLLHAKSHAVMHEAGIFLTGPMRGRLQVTGHGSTQWTDAKRNAGVRFTPITDMLAQWQVALKCPDPRKFGEARTFVASVGSNVTAFHRGNYDAVPRLVVAGSMPGGYVLTLRGQVFVVTEPLLSGQPHSIDYGDGRLRIGGSIVHGGLGYGFTPLVPPGNVTALAIAPRTTGAATATLTLFDTYI